MEGASPLSADYLIDSNLRNEEGKRDPPARWNAGRGQTPRFLAVIKAPP